MVHAQRYFAALAVVLTLLGAYALAVAPWLEPPPIARKTADPEFAELAPSPSTQLDLQRLFPAGSWERDNPKIVETDACTLLVKDYLPTPDGKLELTPCTLIFYAAVEEGKARRPIVLQAPQGAIVQFDRAIDMAKAQVGRLVGGRLPGDITLFSPETAAGADDALHLTTRNIQIDRQRLFTPHEVVFRFGQSHGRGRDLTIALLPKNPEDPSSGIGGIRSLTLAKVERLHLETQGDGPLPKIPGAKGVVNHNAPLEVSCQGPFVFDVTTSTALFDDGVEVVRIHEGSLPDKLTCRQLLLEFAPRDKVKVGEERRGQTNPGAEQDGSDSLAGRVQRMVARGTPVTLEAPAEATRIVAGILDYSVPNRRLVLTPVDRESTITLAQGKNQFVARELEYEMAESSRLGRMWAAGPGELTFLQGQGTAEQTVTAHWNKDLRIQPDGQAQVISLVGNASIAAGELGRFDAGELHLWVHEVEQKSAELTPEKTAKRPEIAIVPQRLLAVENVRLASPKLSVRTARLETWFAHQPARPKGLPPTAPAEPLRAAVNQPVPGDERVQKLPSLAHFDLAGELIQMQVVRLGTEVDLENLTIQGQVVLNEDRTPEPGQQPIRITGDSLELRGGVSGPGTIDVVGQPAEVGGRGMSLAGGEIHLVRDENRLWIDGPGLAKVPGGLAGGERKLPDNLRLVGNLGSSGGSRSPLAQTIHIDWQQGLAFDGLTAEIRGDVQARTATQVATCQSLTATLAQRINFAATRGASAELGKLKLDGGVYVVSRTQDERGEQQSYDQFQVRDLVIDQSAGSLYAAGPGWLSSTRVAKNLPIATGGNHTVPTVVAAPDPAAPPKLNYIHVSFEGAIVGDLKKRELQVQRLVRTTFAPVNDWDERVEVNRLEDLGEKGVLMTSERLTVIEMAPSGQSAWIEASASGNTVVEGKSFTVHAPRITYSSDKEVLSLEGDGRADAELWYRTVPGQPSSYGAASKWRYWLRTGLFDVEGARPFEFQLNGIDKIRLPGGRR